MKIPLNIIAGHILYGIVSFIKQIQSISHIIPHVVSLSPAPPLGENAMHVVSASSAVGYGRMIYHNTALKG